MVTQARSRIQAIRSSKVKENSTGKAEKHFLASVMVYVSASLEKMSVEERDQAIKSAEQPVAHLQ
jgi:hypothetical protein